MNAAPATRFVIPEADSPDRCAAVDHYGRRCGRWADHVTRDQHGNHVAPVGAGMASVWPSS